MSDRFGLEVPGTGAINWHYLSDIVGNVARSRHIPAELASQWKERLKSEATHVVLNTLTVSAAGHISIITLTDTVWQR